MAAGLGSVPGISPPVRAIYAFSRPSAGICCTLYIALRERISDLDSLQLCRAELVSKPMTSQACPVLVVASPYASVCQVACCDKSPFNVCMCVFSDVLLLLCVVVCPAERARAGYEWRHVTKNINQLTRH